MSDEARTMDLPTWLARLEGAIEQMNRRFGRIEGELLAVLGVLTAQLGALIVLSVRR